MKNPATELKKSIKALERSRKTGVQIRKSGKHFFAHAIHANGNILHNTETFERKQSAFKNIMSAALIYAKILAGEAAVHDEKGDAWVWQPKEKKWLNTSVYLRGKLLKPAVALAKEAAKNSGVGIVIKGPRGGVLLDTRKNKGGKKK